MSSIYRMEEWQSSTGKWHCIDTSNFSAGSANWWIPCRILDISPADFVEYLLSFNGNVTWIEKSGLLLWDFDKQSDMRKFKNTINSIARKKNFLI